MREIKWSGLSGNKTVANVEFTAVGSAYIGDLNISIISLKNDTGLAVTGSSKNGSFTLISALTPIPSSTLTEPPAEGGDGGATPRDTTDVVGSTLMPTPTPPDSEALFTIAGLLAVAYLVPKQEKTKNENNNITLFLSLASGGSEEREE